MAVRSACVLIWLLSITKVRSSPLKDLRQTPAIDTLSSDQRVYRCHFYQTVETCLWKRNNLTVSPNSLGFKYVDGLNGVNTTDCSIQGNRIMSNDSNLTCEGRAKPILVDVNKQPGGTIRLHCTAINKKQCSWKRNDEVVSINGRYRYTNQENCSIEINNVSSIDITSWECGEQLTDSITNRDVYAVYLLHDGDTSASFESSTTILPVSTSTITVDNKTQIPSTTESITDLRAVSALAVISFIIVVLIGVVVYMLRRRNKQIERNTIEDDLQVDNSPKFIQVSPVEVEPIYAVIAKRSRSPDQSTLNDVNGNTEPQHDTTEITYTQVSFSQISPPLSSKETSTSVADKDNIIYATIQHEKP